MTDPYVIVRTGRTDERDRAHTFVRPTVRPFISLPNGRKRASLPTLP